METPKLGREFFLLRPLTTTRPPSSDPKGPTKAMTVRYVRCRILPAEHDGLLVDGSLLPTDEFGFVPYLMHTISLKNKPCMGEVASFQRSCISIKRALKEDVALTKVFDYGDVRDGELRLSCHYSSLMESLERDRELRGQLPEIRNQGRGQWADDVPASGTRHKEREHEKQ